VLAVAPAPAPSQLLVSIARDTITADGVSGAPFTVVLRSALGDTLTSDSSTVVTLSLDGPGVLSGDSIVTVSGGFIRDTIRSTSDSGLVRLTATAEGFTSGVDSVLAVAAAPVPSQLLVSISRDTITADGVSGAPFTVVLRSALGDTLASDSSTVVTLSLEGPGVLSGDSTVTVSGGFIRDTIRATSDSGLVRLTASAEDLASGMDSVLAVAPATAAFQLVVRIHRDRMPADGGGTAPYTVEVQDSLGSVLTSDSTTVVKLSLFGPGVLLGDSIAAVTGGVLRDSIRSTTGFGLITLWASAEGLARGRDSVRSIPIQPSHLDVRLDREMVTADARSTVAFVVHVQNSLGDTLSLGDSTLVTLSVDGPGVLLGDSIVTASGGVIRDSIRSTAEAGMITLWASAEGLTSGMDSVLAVLPDRKATQLNLYFHQSALEAEEGNYATFTVALRDSLGSTVTTDSGTVVTLHVDGPATLRDSSLAIGAGALLDTLWSTGAAGRVTLTASAEGLPSSTDTLEIVHSLVDPYKLLVILSRDTLAADGQQEAYFMAYVQDVSGRILPPDSTTVLTLGLEGPGVLLYDTTAMVADGVYPAAVRSTAETGTITLTVSSPGLISGSGSLLALAPGLVRAPAGLEVVFARDSVAADIGRKVIFSVGVRDSAGNPLYTDDSTRVVLSTSGPGTIVGDTSGVVSSGNLFGEILISGAGTIVLTASAEGLAAGTDTLIAEALPEPAAPSPDFDGDGIVGFSDFLQFAAAFGKASGEPEYDTKFDLNGNHSVDFPDFLIFAASFGKPVGGKPVLLAKPTAPAGDP